MRLTSIGLLVSAACLLAGGIAFAAGAGVHKQKADTIRACARKQDGRLRMVASAANCKRGERAVQWNVEGPQGPAGARDRREHRDRPELGRDRRSRAGGHRRPQGRSDRLAPQDPREQSA